MSTIRVEDDGAVRTITLNRPERRNALVPEMMDDLIAALGGSEYVWGAGGGARGGR